jgi:tetratricopeptide (TPR) repeat protein
VAEALINKASSMHRLGRLREALALHEKSVEIADKNGYADHQLRGRNNLSVAQVETEPEKGLQTVLEGIEVARRLGQRSMFNWLVGTGGMYSVAIGGDWDRSLELLEETLSSSPNQYDEARAVMIRGMILSRRGVDLDHLVAKARAAAGDIQDGQIVGGIDYLEAEVAFLQGRYREAVVLALRALVDWPDSDPFVLQSALHSVAVTRNLADAKVVKDKIDRYPSGTPAAQSARAWAGALVDLFEGRPQDALRGMKFAIDTMRSIGMRFDASTAVIDALRLFPDEPEMRAYIPLAREVVERVGATPYLRVLDELVAESGADSAARTITRETANRATTVA